MMDQNNNLGQYRNDFRNNVGDWRNQVSDWRENLMRQIQALRSQVPNRPEATIQPFNSPRYPVPQGNPNGMPSQAQGNPALGNPIPAPAPPQFDTTSQLSPFNPQYPQNLRATIPTPQAPQIPQAPQMSQIQPQMPQMPQTPQMKPFPAPAVMGVGKRKITF